MRNELSELCKLLANDYAYDGNKWEVVKAEKTVLGWKIEIKRSLDDDNDEGAENESN